MNDDFDLFNKQIQVSLAAALKWGDGKLYTSDAADLDEVYLSSFANAKDRQYHNCNACRSFLNRYGGLLVTNGAEVRPALWDFTNPAGTPDHFHAAHAFLNRAVAKARINGIFASKLAKLGQPETNGWTHFWVQNPSVHASPITSAGQLMAQHRQDFLTLRRGLEEFSIETFAAVTNLMESEAAYRGSKFAKQAKGYSDLKTRAAGVQQHRRDVMLFHAIANGMPPGIKSSALGTLYDDLHKGMTVVDALKRFKAVVDPRVYQQPTAAPKAGNIKRAEDIFKAMNLELSLHRRVATFDEIRERCAWTWQGASMMSPAAQQVIQTSMPGIFSGLNNPPLKADPSMAGVSARMSLRKFMEQRSQNVAAMEILHLDKPHPLGTITAALYPDAPPLFAWSSTYGWYRWFAVPGKDFDLGIKANVLGVLDLPSTWFDAGGPHKGLMFVLEGARDKGNVGAGIPAEGLRSELHEVKRTIVAHALQGTLPGAADNHAAGLIVRKDDFKPFVIRADGIDYGITSWE